MGTNDLSKDIKTIDNLKNICDYVSSNSKNTKISVSTITLRKDEADLENKVKIMNDRLRKFADKNGLHLIDNDNIDETCLGKGKLHLNKVGKSLLAKNFMKYLNN